MARRRRALGVSIALAFSVAAGPAWPARDSIRFIPAKTTDTTRVTQKKGEIVVLEVRSPNGVGSGRLSRTGAAWPGSISVRLRGFREIEHFRASTSSMSLICALERPEGVVAERVCRLEGDTLDALKVSGKDFIIALPPALFASNPDEIVLEWVDFWR